MSRTNLDVIKEKISGMSAEEFYISSFFDKDCDYCPYHTEDGCIRPFDSDCKSGVTAWLNAEVKPQRVRYEFDMPESCYKCPLITEDVFCILTDENIVDDKNNRNPHCPLPSMVIEE